MFIQFIESVYTKALITSFGSLFHCSLTLLAKLYFKTSLLTLSLYNFIEWPIVLDIGSPGEMLRGHVHSIAALLCVV